MAGEGACWVGGSNWVDFATQATSGSLVHLKSEVLEE